jgi:hypothetical protein
MNLIEKYKLKPAVEILRDLYLLKQRERSGEEISQPQITIMPGSKLPISGFVIDFEDDKDKRGVVLEVAGTSDLSFIELYWITGVTIHNADKIAPYLLDITAADINLKATRLDLKNKMKKESEQLSQSIGSITFDLTEEDFPSTAEQLYIANLFTTDLSMSLIEIAKTDLGKESIKGKIKTIRLKKGKALDIKLTNGILLVSHDFNRSYTTNAARNQLIELIYNLL